jgi:[protein-PII] uridylyltransferase
MPSSDNIGLARASLLARADLVGAPLRAELTALLDHWLADLLGDLDGVALIAVGGLGRREPTPYSDLDLVLLHNGKNNNISTIADGLWYPIWDSGIGLDHSVRTVDQALAVAKDDLKAILGMLDVRHLAGDPALSGQLREQIITVWRRTAANRLPELQELARSRWATRGDGSFLLEPDLKDCRGGLRDWVGLRALASAQLVDLPASAVAASTTLLDVRGELHRLSGRGADVLRAQDRSTVAAALGLRTPGGEPDGDTVLRSVNEACRTIAYATDSAWRRVVSTQPTQKSFLRRLRPGAPDLANRTPLAKDVVAQDGEVVLARDADPLADPVLTLRVARAAAEHDLPIATYTLNRLATESPALPEPWPAEARDEFVTLLGAGLKSVAAIEALDQHGLMSRLMPEWEHVRFRAQYNPVHRFTVDRHLIETAVAATGFTSDVSRPDLLLVGAFLHDIGKGHPGDHSVVGAELARIIALRMGFSSRDADTIANMALYHLLLPDTATRRDLDDPSTIRSVATAIGESAELLDLLHPLTKADAAATGPAAWSDWKGGLVARLVYRTRLLLSGEALPAPGELPAELVELARDGLAHVVVDGSEVTLIAPDSPGVLSRFAGLLALHSLDVQSADVRTVSGMAVNRFVVAPRFGGKPDVTVLNSDLRRLLDGALSIDDRLRAKEAAYLAPAPSQAAPPKLLWFDDEATDASVLEVRTRDAIGLLHWITDALERSGVDIRTARISSLGAYVVDAFYLTDSDGKPLTEEHQRTVTDAVTAALTA